MDPAPANAPAPLALSVRIDKWLWAVRLYKTRSLAADACRAGQVAIGGIAVKPSRDVRPGEIITARAADVLRTVKVLAPISQRVGPKHVSAAMEDLTPAEEFLRALRKKEDPAAPHRAKGAGRPTKKDRRDIERFAPE